MPEPTDKVISAMPARPAISLGDFLDVGARTVELMLTTGCNLQCAYCYQQRKTPRTMAPEVLDAAIRQLVSSRFDHPRLTLYGGEPLLAESLVRRALDRIREWAPPRMKPDVQIVTNGTRLDEEMARLLVGRDVFITLSFDGIAAAQDDRSPGTFETLDRLLVRLRRGHPKHFSTRLGVKVTLTSRNVRYLASSFRYFLSRGVRDVDVVPVFSDDGGWTARSARELNRQLAEVTSLSIDKFRRSGAIPFRPFRGSAAASTADSGPVCACGSRGLLFVDVDGALAPCAALASSTLESRPKALRHVAKTLGNLHVTDPNLPASLLRREERASRLPFLAGPENRRGPDRPCARCRIRFSCFVCPVAVACNGRRVPAFHCGVNRLLDRHNQAFRQASASPPVPKPNQHRERPRPSATTTSASHQPAFDSHAAHGPPRPSTTKRRTRLCQTPNLRRRDSSS